MVGLETSVQDWDIEFAGEKRSGSNVYGILHAPRGENLEAMVLAAPWINQDGKFNHGGIALVGALARYLSKWTVWSKNIIFVISSDSHLGMRSWVEAYHSTLGTTAGAIEAAVILDYPEESDYFGSLEVIYEGLNGQLPNLDLVNTALLIARHEGLPVTVQGLDAINNNDYWTRATTFFRGLIAQLSAGFRPGPGSDTFSGYRINAITVRAKPGSGSGDITTCGRIAESTLRSVNNLLEHFHQSFFFYFLMSPRTFVSIGTYLPAVFLVALTFSLMAFYNIAQRVINSDVSFLNRQSVLHPFGLLFSIYLFCFLFGFSTINIFNTGTVLVLVLGMSTIFSIIGVVLVRMAMKQSYLTPPIQLSAVALSAAHSYAMIIHGLLLTTLGMLNFSLAFFIGLATFPLVWITPLEDLSRIKSHNILSIILIFISNPWTWLKVVYDISNHGKSSSSVQEGFYYILDNLLWGWRGLNVWTWGIICGIWLPLWLVSICVATLGSPVPIGYNKVKHQ